MQDNRRRDNHMRPDRRRRPELTAEQVKRQLTRENGPELLMKDADQALRPALELYAEVYAPAAAPPFMLGLSPNPQSFGRIPQGLFPTSASLRILPPLWMH